MRRKKDSSNLTSIEEIEKKFKTKGALQIEIASLSELAAAQELTIQKLHDELDKKGKEIAHLQEMLAGAVPIINENPVEILEKTDEEEIALIQLQKLKDAARIRQLTLDEVRMFDLLTKNKRLAQEQPTDISGSYKTLDAISTKELLAIAGSVMDKKDVE